MPDYDLTFTAEHGTKEGDTRITTEMPIADTPATRAQIARELERKKNVEDIVITSITPVV